MGEHWEVIAVYDFSKVFDCVILSFYQLSIYGKSGVRCSG